jgi:septum formation inhibitor-activating ATPase MinD
MRIDAFDQILHVLAERFDVIILDCPVELTDPIVAQVALRRAHRIAMVLNNEQATLTDGRRAIDLMCRPRTGTRSPGLGIQPDQIGIIVNQKVEGVGRDDVGVRQALAGGDEVHAAQAVPVITTIADDRVTWVRNANLGRPVATRGESTIDGALDSALSALIPGAAELLGTQPTVTIPGVEDVWGAPPAGTKSRFLRGKRA